MQKCYLELLDVIRAEIADLYRLRGEDHARLRRLERLARRPMPAGPEPSVVPSSDPAPANPR